MKTLSKLILLSLVSLHFSQTCATQTEPSSGAINYRYDTKDMKSFKAKLDFTTRKSISYYNPVKDQFVVGIKVTASANFKFIFENEETRCNIAVRLSQLDSTSTTFRNIHYRDSAFVLDFYEKQGTSYFCMRVIENAKASLYFLNFVTTWKLEFFYLEGDCLKRRLYVL